MTNEDAMARMMKRTMTAYCSRDDMMRALVEFAETPVLWRWFGVALEIMDDECGWCKTCGTEFDWADDGATDGMCPACGGEDLHGHLTTHNPIDDGGTAMDILNEVLCHDDDALMGIWMLDAPHSGAELGEWLRVTYGD